LGGLLTTVKAHFSTIQREMESLQNIGIFDRTTHLIDEACQEVRRIAHGMVPHSIQISGLIGALEELVDTLNLQGMICDLEVHQFPEGKLNEQKAAMIYRIIQELTQNAVKHGAATKMHIQLLGHEGRLHIMVEDNGHGFDVDSAGQQKGLGLKSIDSRIKYLGGTIQFDSSPQHGTVVNMEIPV
jgi:signal transduction histidine kinase